MSKRQRSRQELEELLVEQINFLEASADAFDKGFESEAKRLAVTTRVLLHNTSNSHSLLSQLGHKTVLFWSTALPNEPGNETPHGGLVFMTLGGNESKYVAMLDDVPQLRQISFDEWWNSEVFTDDQKHTLSRKDLILTAANQDGGAHVDPGLDETYARLSKDNSMGWVTTDASGTKPMPGPERAAIRQIAHEVLKTLKPNYQKKIEYDVGMLIGGIVTTTGDTAAAIIARMNIKGLSKSSVPINTKNSTKKIGRNDQCPCGSGTKFKKCHGAHGYF